MSASICDKTAQSGHHGVASRGGGGDPVSQQHFSCQPFSNLGLPSNFNSRVEPGTKNSKLQEKFPIIQNKEVNFDHKFALPTPFQPNIFLPNFDLFLHFRKDYKLRSVRILLKLQKITGHIKNPPPQPYEQSCGS